MKKLVWFIAAALLLCAFTGCGESAPTPTGESAPTLSVTTQPASETASKGPSATDLVGSWQMTHSEVEGDKTENDSATLAISGDGIDSLTFSYTDSAFPNANAENLALTVKEGALFTDCGNNSWYAEVMSTGIYSYAITLLEDDTAVLQVSFDFDGQPMASTQWFARIK